jgi:TatA/E family protein of Tat protein translocase
MGLSPIQIAVVLLVVLLLFGHRLPSLARSLGSSLIEFKKGVKDADDAPALHESKE